MPKIDWSMIDKLLEVYSQYCKKFKLNFPDKGTRAEKLQHFWGHMPDDPKEKQYYMNKFREWIDHGLPRQVDGPSGRKEWLSNFNIDHYIHDFQERYPDFLFLKAVPLDCDQHSFCSLNSSNLNIDKELSKGKDLIAVVYNMDKVGQPGSHWVALVMNFKKKEAAFYNPAKATPPTDINRMIDKFKKMVPGAKVIISDKKHQVDGSECGIYSINFILRYLRGEPFEEIIDKGLDFNSINSCRNLYFKNTEVDDAPHYKC